MRRRNFSFREGVDTLVGGNAFSREASNQKVL